MAEQINVDELLDFAPAFLIDAFGVLVDHGGVRPGAREFLERLDAQQTPWLVLTNDAARSPDDAAAWYRECGLPIANEKVLTSGSMVAVTLKERGLHSRDVLVLGPQASKQLLIDAGVSVLGGANGSYDDKSPFDVLVVCDEMGFSFLETLNVVLSELMKKAALGALPPCFVANPDLIYPAGDGNFALAAGSVASLIEAGVNVHHDVGNFFEPLGKPAAPIFKEALRRLGVNDAVMLGDTLHTDVAGAKAAGLKAVLVGKTLEQLPSSLKEARRPDALIVDLRSIEPDKT
ncbi:MAG: HAD-IA family hydrolase [Deltaproteobacteria bacterium]|nr:HAD-IA family hydrolase [Deltaproteobacteria bacterium]